MGRRALDSRLTLIVRVYATMKRHTILYYERSHKRKAKAAQLKNFIKAIKTSAIVLPVQVLSNLPTALNRMHELGVCNSFLDYGTGKGLLVQRLKKLVNPKINVTGYDPSVAEYSVHPEGKYDIVSCLDVLEHVELDSIDSVIDDIANLTKDFATWWLIFNQQLKQCLTVGMLISC